METEWLFSLPRRIGHAIEELFLDGQNSVSVPLGCITAEAVYFSGPGTDSEAVSVGRVDHFLNNIAICSVGFRPALVASKAPTIEDNHCSNKFHFRLSGSPDVNVPTSVFKAFAIRARDRNVRFLSPLSIPPT